MFCRPTTDGPTVLFCCPSISFRARINSVAVHVPLAVGLFYFAAVDPAPDLARALPSGLLGVVNLALASLALYEEGAALKLPRLGLLKAWLVLAYLNIGAVAFVLVCLLDTLKGDAGINLAMSFGAVFTVMTTVILCHTWVVVFSYYEEICLRVENARSDCNLAAVISDKPPAATDQRIVGFGNVEKGEPKTPTAAAVLTTSL